MGKIPMQQWYPDAHLADTALLSLEEQGAYRLLLDNMWIKGGYLRDDDKEIARLLRTSLAKWRKIKKILESFLYFYGENISQRRLLEDYKRAVKKSKANALNGSKGGQKTWENKREELANASAKTNSFAKAKENVNATTHHVKKAMRN